MLTDIHDEELVHLPDIHVHGEGPDKSRATRRHNQASRSFDNSANVVVDIRINEVTDKTCDHTSPRRSPERVSCNGCSAVPEQAGSKSNVTGTQTGNLLRVPSPKLMLSRRNLSQLTFRDLQASKSVSSSQTQLYKLGADLLPGKIKPYRKSLSQRELSIEEKQNCLPVIFTNETRRSVGLLRSASAVTLLPPIPSTINRPALTSQPDIQTTTGTTPIGAESSCTTLLARRLQVRDLWRTALERFRTLRQSDDNRGGEGDESWVTSPGDGLRPAYSRWKLRRDALAEPERMCMPQVLREQIQKDAQSRKRSVKRKISKFLNVKLGLNLEEDLAA